MRLRPNASLNHFFLVKTKKTNGSNAIFDANLKEDYGGNINEKERN